MAAGVSVLPGRPHALGPCLSLPQVYQGFLARLVFVPGEQGPGGVGWGTVAAKQRAAVQTVPLGALQCRVTDLVTITSKAIRRAVAQPGLSPGHALFASHTASLEMEGPHRGAQPRQAQSDVRSLKDAPAGPPCLSTTWRCHTHLSAHPTCQRLGLAGGLKLEGEGMRHQVSPTAQRSREERPPPPHPAVLVRSAPHGVVIWGLGCWNLGSTSSDPTRALGLMWSLKA